MGPGHGVSLPCRVPAAGAMPRSLGSLDLGTEEMWNSAMTVMISPDSRARLGESFSQGFSPIVILVAVHFLFCSP